MPQVVVGNDPFHNKKPAVRWYHRRDLAQDSHGVVVVPAVQDLGQHIDVTARGNLGEEVSSHEVATIGDVRFLDYMGQIKQDAPQVRVLGEQRGKQRAVAPSNVNDRSCSAPVPVD